MLTQGESASTGEKHPKFLALDLVFDRHGEIPNLVIPPACSRSPSPIENTSVFTRAGEGPELTVRSDNTSDYFVFSEVFERLSYEVPLAFEPRSILDFGANNGMTAIYFQKRYANSEIACVEPVPENVSLLQADLARNGVRARVFEAAITAERGPVTIIQSRAHYGSKVARIDLVGALMGRH